MMLITFLEKKFYNSFENIELFADFIFENIEFYCVKEFFKVNQTDFPHYPYDIFLMQKNSAHNFPREEVDISLGNIELFALFLFDSMDFF